MILHQSDESINIHGFQNAVDNETENSYRPRFKREIYLFFDVGVAFDSSFCHLYGEDGSYFKIPLPEVPILKEVEEL